MQIIIRYQILKKGRGYFCEAFLPVIIFKNDQTFWFFDIVGGMCASLIYQSFKIQINLLPSKCWQVAYENGPKLGIDLQIQLTLCILI